MFATQWILGFGVSARVLDDLSSRGTVAVLGMLSGALLTWLLEHWKRHKEYQCIIRGDARDMVVIHQHLVTTAQVPNEDGVGTRTVPVSLRIRSLGQAELDRVVPNGRLAADLLQRAFQVTAENTLISMEGPEGSYLLETLNDFVCDRVSNAPFEHDMYVMAACCEPATLAVHQPITILLITEADLSLFESWSTCRNVQVEHGSDGMRVLTLMKLANRHREEQQRNEQLRAAGESTRHAETMYLLDLGLDKRSASIPLRHVPWQRFAAVLGQLELAWKSQLQPAKVQKWRREEVVI